MLEKKVVDTNITPKDKALNESIRRKSSFMLGNLKGKITQ